MSSPTKCPFCGFEDLEFYDWDKGLEDVQEYGECENCRKKLIRIYTFDIIIEDEDFV